MSYFSQNLKFLRKSKELTQSELSKKIQLSRPQLGSYEEGRAEPKLEILRNIALFFKVSLDDLVSSDLSKSKKIETKASGENLRVLPIVVDDLGNEKVSLVSAKAAAGYLNGYADPEFIEELPSFDLPLPELLPGTYRLFQLKGESMEPIPNNSYVLCQYRSDWTALKDYAPCVVISQSEGLVFKRVHNLWHENQTFELHSDNPAFEPYQVPCEEVLELWEVQAYINFDLSKPQQAPAEINHLSAALAQLKSEVDKLKSEQDRII